MTQNTFIRRKALGAVLAVCGLAATGVHAQAQTQAQANWPAKSIRVVVGFAPGGTTDVVARVLSQGLSEALGQPVIVDNKPGASGNIAAAEVVRAAPDGYTFFLSPTSVETANPSLFKSPILPSRDLTPVVGIAKTQMYLVAKPQMAVKDVKELVALAKSQPGKLSYASAGAGTPPHLACELFKINTGTFIAHIPYRGAAPALQDVMAGQADFVCDPGIAFPHIKAGKVKLLGVVSNNRSPFFPDVPTVAEQGFKGDTMDIWFGMWAPNGTHPEIIARVSKEAAKVLGQASVKTRLGDLGAESTALDTSEFKKLLADEGKLLSKLIKDQKIAVE